jgi:hypothetical protein
LPSPGSLVPLAFPSFNTKRADLYLEACPWL